MDEGSWAGAAVICYRITICCLAIIGVWFVHAIICCTIEDAIKRWKEIMRR